jgi:hypothetical protein
VVALAAAGIEGGGVSGAALGHLPVPPHGWGATPTWTLPGCRIMITDKRGNHPEEVIS